MMISRYSSVEKFCVIFYFDVNVKLVMLWYLCEHKKPAHPTGLLDGGC